jgi:uncharacterized membrane protein YGL010W
MVLLDLETQLVFYRSYHHNPLNVLVHLIFVPVLTFTTLILATSTGNFLELPYIPLNGAAIMVSTYMFLYYLMEPIASALMTPLILLTTWYINKLSVEHGSQALWIAGIVNVGSWIAQFLGHGIFEKRAPAMKDNFVQAFFLAPFFVWFELLFSLGYRPELHQRIEEKAVAKIAKYNAEKKGAKGK